MKKKLLSLTFLAVIARVILLFVVNYDLKMNTDEETIYQIAVNHQNGHGYAYYHDVKKVYIPTAFHSSFPIFTYEFLLENGISKEAWVIFIYALSVITFGFSIFYFYKLALYFLVNEK